MDVDAITLDLVTRTLRAWRLGQEPPGDLLTLDLLQEPASSTPVERSIRLREQIYRTVEDELRSCRRAENLRPSPPSTTRGQLLETMKRDFSTGNSVLHAWSALFHRYVSAVPFDTDELAAHVPVAPRQFQRYVDAGLRRLTDNLRRLELAAHDQAAAVNRRRYLPPPDYAQLFGTAAPLSDLVALLRRPDGPRFVSVEGLGGIGKTALARAVAFDLAEGSDFDGIAWISARQTRLSEQGTIEVTPDGAETLTDVVNRLADQTGLALAGLSTSNKLGRLAAFLRNAHYLVVVDNLESVRDVETLLPALTPLADPTRFLFTSRQTMSTFPQVFRYAVPQLTLASSQQLVESELRRRGQNDVLSDGAIKRLYDLVGGVPLALKLVAAQMMRWPLDTLLDDMRHVRRRAPESLYNFIYRRTWFALPTSAQELLLSLLDIAPDGENLDWLRLVSALPPDEFDDALNQLLAYSLLDLAGPSDMPYYRLHRLTATFLQTDLLGSWSGKIDQDV